MLSRSSTRLLTVVAALLSLALLVPAGASAQTVTLSPANETIFFGAGCPPANPAGSCASTQYFLSRSAGTSNVGNILTAVSWFNRTSSGDYTSNTYTADSSLKPSYLLRGGGSLAGQIEVGGYIGGAEFAVDSGVEVIISAHRTGEDASERVTLLEATIVKQVVVAGDTVYAFQADIPAELDRVRVDGIRATVGHDSLTVLGNGFVDGTGGSSFKLPYYRETVTTP